MSTIAKTSMRLTCMSLLLFWTLAAQATEAAEFFSSMLHDLDGKPVSLAGWQRRPLLVNFWARWCGPCRAEIPELVKLRARLRDEGLEVIGIAVEERTAALKDFVRAYEMDYPVLVARDKGLELMKALGNAKMSLPFTVAIDREGRLVGKKLGAASGEELARLAASALAQ
ncbi:MAG: TlpA family protein disulfide reductase [Rhodocyclaceae bacterium]|nr:TlpA family protein disulfide reductase [Rhodocyclaceae bacterium]